MLRQVCFGVLSSVRKEFIQAGVILPRSSRVIKANVPILTAELALPGLGAAIKLDVSVAASERSSTSLRSTSWVCTQITTNPPLRWLVLRLKELLSMHQLADASTGGLSGMSQFVMVRLLVGLVIEHGMLLSTLTAYYRRALHKRLCTVPGC